MPAPEDPTPIALIANQLERVEAKIDRLDEKIDGRATKEDIERIDGRIDGHHTRLEVLERDAMLRAERAKVHQERDQRTILTRHSKWQIAGALLGGSAALATVALAFVAVFQLFH
jgi:hypothetical protein